MQAILLVTLEISIFAKRCKKSECFQISEIKVGFKKEAVFSE